MHMFTQLYIQNNHLLHEQYQNCILARACYADIVWMQILCLETMQWVYNYITFNWTMIVLLEIIHTLCYIVTQTSAHVTYSQAIYSLCAHLLCRMTA